MTNVLARVSSVSPIHQECSLHSSLATKLVIPNEAQLELQNE